jgi:hypothetical protein
MATKPKRRVWQVGWQDRGGYWEIWEVGQKASDRRDFRPTQVQAITWAKALAKKNRPSQVRVRGKSGRVLYECTYGQDPKRYPG